MRTVGFSFVLLVVCACTLGCPHAAMDSGGGEDHRHRNACPPLNNADGSTYTAVTGNFSSGHCEFTWNLDDPTLDKPGHPEVYLNAHRGDTMTFASASNFTYSITPNAPAGVNESMCFASPVNDPNATQAANNHKPGKVQHNSGGPKKCHYNIIFNNKSQAAEKAELDPHIVVGGT